jgi:hypothetical protein
VNKTAFMRELRRVRKLEIEKREQAIAEIYAREGIEPPPCADAVIRIPCKFVEMVECKPATVRFRVKQTPGTVRVGDDAPTVEQIRHLFRGS